MITHMRLRAGALLFISLGGWWLLRPLEVNASMCSTSRSCGICCYGDPIEQALCCASECPTYCLLLPSTCCPGGGQITECY